MDAGIIPNPTFTTRQNLSRSRAATVITAPRLTRRASLMLTFLLSLGLWTAIWALVSALLRWSSS